jgi:hypothetical protein
MSDNLHTIFSGSECPPHSLLMDYFLRKLPEEEMHRIEAHLIDCEMCSDELEGLSKMRDHRDLDAIVEEINERVVLKKVRFLGLSRNYALLAAAALIGLIVGSVVIVRILTSTGHEEMMSVVVEPSVTMHENVPPPPTPEAATPEEKKDGKSAKENKTSAQPMATVAVEADEEPILSVMEISDTQYVKMDLAEKPAETKALAYSQGVAETATIKTEGLVNTTPAAAQSFDKKAEQTGGIRSGGNTRQVNLMDIAMEEFNAGDYFQAATFFEQVVTNQPANGKAAYHLAYCYFMEKRYKKASKALDPLLKDAGNEYYSEALILAEKIRTAKDR